MARRGTAAVVCALACGGAASANVILDWNGALLNAIRADATAPPKAARAMAMAHVAAFDAVNAIDGTHEHYAFTSGSVAAGTVREAAAAGAMHRVLSSLFPSQQAMFDATLSATLSGLGAGGGVTAGLALGQSSGDAMLALRSNDGSGVSLPAYTGGNGIGQWRPAPPANASGALPHWKDVSPFAMTSGSQFRGAAPPTVTSAAYTAAYNQVKEIGALNSATRTQDQTNIARFWIDGPGTATPPGHMLRIASAIAAQESLSVSESARLFALMGLAEADAGVAAWDIKYTYSFWRPITAIREGDADGNASTIGDSAWEPLIPTPNHPSYTSGHSTFSAAGASVLENFFGTSSLTFVDSSETGGVPDRAFTDIWDAANEAGLSRIYGGIHWSFDNTEGLACGDLIGDWVFANYLRPVPAPSGVVVMAMAVCVSARRRR